jgi:hypothetical protein
MIKGMVRWENCATHMGERRHIYVIVGFLAIHIHGVVFWALPTV